MSKSGEIRVVSAFFLTVTIRILHSKNRCRSKRQRDLAIPLTPMKSWLPTQMKDRGWDFQAYQTLDAPPQPPLMVRITATRGMLSLRKQNKSKSHLTDVAVIMPRSSLSKPDISLRPTRASMKRWRLLTTQHTKRISRRRHHLLSGAMRTSRAESSSTHLSMASDWLSYF